MFCQKCGNQIPDGSVNCNFCGAPQQNGAPVTQPTFTPPAPPQKNNKTVLIAVIAALVVIIAVLVGIFVIKPAVEKDDDTTKKSKKTTEVTVVTTAPPVTDAPVFVTAEAEAALDDYLSSFSATELLVQSGSNVNELGQDGEIGLAVFDLMMSKTQYEIISSEEISSNSAKVSARFYIPDMAVAAGIYEEEVYAYIESHPTITEDQLIDLIPEIYGIALNDSRVGKTTTEITFTVNRTNGKWTVQYSKQLESALLDALESAS